MLIEQIICEAETNATTAQAATMKGAMDLSQTNLLGIFGTKDAPRALILLPDGSRKKVTIGDTVNGMTISGISADNGRIEFDNGSQLALPDPVISKTTGTAGMDKDGNIVQYGTGNGMTTSLRPKARPTDYEPVDPDAIDQAIQKALRPKQPNLKKGDYRQQPYHPFRPKGD